MSEPRDELRPAAPAGAERFVGFAVRRPVALLVTFATLLVIGVIAYQRIPLQLFPDGLVEPSLGIWVPNPGSTAQENEEKVARSIEEQLRTLTGIERVRNWSDDGGTWFRVDFAADVDMDFAKSEVRDRLERARPSLPTTVEEINVWDEDASQIPVIWFGILHPGESDRTDYLLDQVVRPRLEAVPGVGRVEIWGVQDDAVRILLDEEKTLAAGLDIGDLVGRLSQDNFALPMGDVDDGGREVILRSDMRFTSPEEVARFPIRDGLVVGDLGRVVRAKSVREWISKIDGDFAYFCTVTKDSRSNVVEVSRALEAAVTELGESSEIGDDLDFAVFGTQGEFIESSLAQLRSTALWGGAFAVLILFAFLRRLRLTLCVALSIPVSALLALAFVYFRGGTFNVLTMCGITLGIGMLVDNSVVVVENIARMRADGARALEAATRGTGEIALAVTLATLTSVVVFLPLIFMSENPIIRLMFGALGIPLCVSLCFSLLVAIVFLPVIAARILGERPASVQRALRPLGSLARIPAGIVARLFATVRYLWHGLFRGLARANRPVLRALVWPVRVLLAAAALGLAWLASARAGERLEATGALSEFGVGFGAGGPAAASALLYWLPAGLVAVLLLVFVPHWRRGDYRAWDRPASWVPRADSLIDMVIAVNRSLVSWTLRHRLLASALAFLSLASVAVPLNGMDISPFGQDEDTSQVHFRIDFEAPMRLAEAHEELGVYEDFVEEHREEWGFAHWNLRFHSGRGGMYLFWEEPRPPEELDAIRDRIREEVPRIAGHRVELQGEEEASLRSSAFVRFVLRGPDSAELERLGEDAIALLEEVPGLVSVSSPLESAPDQLEVSFDRDLAHALGVRPEVAVNTIAWYMRGWPLPRFHDEGREIPFLIEYDDAESIGLESLRDLPVWTGTSPVPLSAFADLAFAPGQREIYREDGQSTFDIQARVSDPSRVTAFEEAGHRALSRLELPRGYAFGLDVGARARQEEEFGELTNALLLSVSLVFLLMGILFESITRAVAVLFTIPFAALGGFWTLFLTRTNFDSLTFIGLIILAGVVVNNGIVLVDRIYRLQVAGAPIREAVVEGCGHRVRPVLMTALTTVCGLLPMAIAEPSTNSLDYRALATCVAGGLVAATFFTLWVVPLAYTVADDVERIRRRAVATWILRAPGAPRAPDATTGAADPS